MSGIIIFSSADVFPKQKTIAAKIGVSERSVTRAVQELFKAGLILIECKHTNRYKIVQNRGGFARENEKKFNPDNLSESSSKNDSKKTDNLSETHEHEPKKAVPLKSLLITKKSRRLTGIMRGREKKMSAGLLN